MQRTARPFKSRARFGPRSSAQWFALPAVLLLGLFLLYPFVDVLRFSTWDWSGLSAPRPIGLENYRQILQDPDFYKSLRTTLIFSLITLPPFILLSVLLALALDGQPYERGIKALLFLPGLVTLGGAAVAWYTLFSPEYGALAAVVPVPRWDQSVGWALVLIMLFTLWRHIGYGVLVVSARLKAIPKALTEAAAVDGANPLQTFRFITLPLLRPALTFLVVIGTVLTLQSYTAVFLLTRGGPFGGTEVLGYYLYKTGFEIGRLGYAAALTVVILILTLAFALAQARLLREER
ncbi:carbohydrate ABC transporter permease [Meiothermus granaticius]|uniref:Lactose transport system permease protein LacF n=1 Tax=Meiothermus granaticius NBRC 107808 TaxID=1227551 RepID=A0A399FDZ6_9DEIN|nr:sugar ABC transporter permease [Meiothermus granaticius]RIH93252.1 Lactose transport system permease protein LacF [Meiothermus granaticius NBRC 107808]GEM86429.1 sugar ABC transporter permease [Meiothermus granaticius NBRC 107808]